MIEITGNLFSPPEGTDAICVTTNGFVKSNGEAVMDRGCAKTLASHVPQAPKLLGDHLKANGNCPGILMDVKGIKVVSYPVKPPSIKYLREQDVVSHMRTKFKMGAIFDGWASVVKLYIITLSAKRLVKMADEQGWEQVIIPRPGCGAGELDWETVKPELAKILDDRFQIITFK